MTEPSDGGSRARSLPMVGEASAGGGEAPAASLSDAEERLRGHALEPDPERIRDGWEHRFAAVGARADEMIALYRELGFEVVADPIGSEQLIEGCATCFGSSAEIVKSIYTRRPRGAGAAAEGNASERHEGAPARPDGGPAPTARGVGSTPGVAAGELARPKEERAMHETHPTRVLREEHQRILAVAGALEEALDAYPQDVDFDRVDKCIRFIRLFADACHHGKEEGLLFPTLVDAGLPRESGPIAVMLHEHRLGREFARAMAESIDGAREGNADAHARLERAAAEYVALIRAHIMKEDNVLFNMADQMVAGPACRRLCAAYDETGGHTFEGCSKAQLEELAREIAEGR